MPVLKNLLDERLAAGRLVRTGICEHFDLSRQELFDVVAVHGYRTFDDLVTAHGRGRGCDVCKPAVASILASQLNGHVLDESTVALQDTNDAYLANIQRNGTYSVVPRVPGGEITPDRLIVIGEVARDSANHRRSADRPARRPARAAARDLARLVDAGFESGHAYGKSLRTVKSCVGSTWCRYGVQDSVRLAIDLENRYRGLRSPHKIKAGVSGCARVRRGPGQGLRCDRHREGLEPVRRRQRRREPRARALLATDLDTETLVGTSTGSSCTTSAPPTGCSAPAPGSARWTAAWTGSARSWSTTRSVSAPSSRPTWPGTSTPTSTSGGPPWRTRKALPVRLLRQRPGTPDPTIAFTTERGQIQPVLEGEDGGPADRRRLHPGGRAMTATETWTGLRAGRARGRAGRRGAGPRAGGGDLPHPRRHGVRAGQPRPVQPGGRDRPRHRRHRGDVPFVASPMHKNAFDLRTGRCLDDEATSVPSVRGAGGRGRGAGRPRRAT